MYDAGMTIEKNDLARWELAGMLNSSGSLAPELNVSSKLLIPTQILLEGDSLCWSWTAPEDGREAFTYAAPLGKILEQFVGLANSGPDRILDFAKSWGPLQICQQHNLPETHNPLPIPWSDATGDKWMAEMRGPMSHVCLPYQPKRGWWSEPLERWTFFARQARAMLNIAARLRNMDEPGRKEDWEDVREGIIRQRPSLGRAVAFDQWVLNDVLEHWLALGNVRLGAHGDPSAPDHVPLKAKLFGYIGAQLLAAIKRTPQLVSRTGIGVSSSAISHVP